MPFWQITSVRNFRMFTMVGKANRTKLVYGYCVLVETYLSVLSEDATDQVMLDLIKEMKMMKLIRGHKNDLYW